MNSSASQSKFHQRLAYVRGMRHIGFMTHTIIGYPNMAECEDLVSAMAESGADFIKLQIPFSDPIADDSTLLAANHWALAEGVSVRNCMKFIEKMAKAIVCPLIFATYANVPFVYGIDAFCRDAKNAGAEAIVIPDLPFDDDEGYWEASERYAIPAIPIVTPVVSETRLRALDGLAKGFIHCLIPETSSRNEADRVAESAAFLERMRTISNKPLAVEAGVTQPEDVSDLVNRAEIVAVGSRLLDVYNEGDQRRFELVAKFLRALQKA